MTKQEYIDYCKTIIGAAVDQPFEEDFTTYAVRHIDTKKWFGLIMQLNGENVVNLKSEPMQSDFLRSVYKGVIPAYHMNKTHWNTVYLESDVPTEEIERMTMESYHLTKKSPRKKSVKVNS